MSNYPYLTNTKQLTRFLEKIQTVGRPEKVTHQYIQSLGFKSRNDRPIIPAIKALGLLTTSGEPTDRWIAYRDKAKAPRVLAVGITEVYSDLFKVYNDAYRKDDEALKAFFTSNTTLGEKAVGLMVRTFKALCEIADFTEAQEDPGVTVKPADEPVTRLTVTDGTNKNGNVTLNVNIQLTLPKTENSDIYDNIFKSLKKHILS